MRFVAKVIGVPSASLTSLKVGGKIAVMVVAEV